MTYEFPKPTPEEIGRYTEAGVLITLCHMTDDLFTISLYTDFEGCVFTRIRPTLAIAALEFTRTIRAELAGRADSYVQALAIEANPENLG